MFLFFILNNLSFFVFCIGAWGVTVVKNNVVVILMSMELIIFAVIINLLVFSAYFDNMDGQIFSLFLMVIAACESALGLAIIVIQYRLRGSLKNIFFTTLKT